MLAERQDLALLRLTVLVELTVAGDQFHLGDAFGQLQRRLERVREAPLDALTEHEPVDDDLDRVLLVPGQLGARGEELVELVDLPVDPGADEALAREVRQQGLVLALAAPDHRGEDLETRALR